LDFIKLPSSTTLQTGTSWDFLLTLKIQRFFQFDFHFQHIHDTASDLLSHSNNRYRQLHRGILQRDIDQQSLGTEHKAQVELSTLIVQLRSSFAPAWWLLNCCSQGLYSVLAGIQPWTSVPVIHLSTLTHRLIALLIPWVLIKTINARLSPSDHTLITPARGISRKPGPKSGHSRIRSTKTLHKPGFSLFG
jgi:hypothetical protein